MSDDFNGFGSNFPTPEPVPFPAPEPDRIGVAPSEADAKRPRITRAQAQQMRRMEREGVPMWLTSSAFEATVQALSFADRTMLNGIDPKLQAELAAGMNGRGMGAGDGGRTFGDIVRGIANEERMVNAVCCAGFVSPRLTLTKQEADLANNDDVWWVEEINIEDRRRYSGFVLGTDEEEARRIASFLADRVQNA